MNIRKYLKNLLRIKNIDPINKEYFTESSPVAWYGLGMALCFIWSAGTFENIKDFISAIIFMVFLSGAAWCTYRFLVVLSYKKAPEDSPARLLWLQDKERSQEYLSEKYDQFLGPVINPIIETIGSLFLWSFRIGLLIAGIWFLSSFSVHSLLVLIVILILLK